MSKITVKSPDSVNLTSVIMSFSMSPPAWHLALPLKSLQEKGISLYTGVETLYV